MKTAVILLALLVALAAANENCPLEKAMMKSFDTCKESLNPSKETLDLVAKEEGEDNRDVNCFQACLATNAGLMNGANFDIEKMESLLRSAEDPKEDVIKAVVEMMEECKKEAEVSDDPCEVTGKYAACAKSKREAMKAAQ